MTPPSSVTTWLAALKAGDPATAEALWQRYFAQLVVLARQHLARHVRRAADEEDVALAALARFCAGAPDRAARARGPDPVCRHVLAGGAGRQTEQRCPL